MTRGKREPSCDVAGDAISIMRCRPDFSERRAARSASAFECLDDDHAAAAARAWMREEARLGLIGVIGALVLFAWDRRGEQLARAGDVLSADAAREQAVMANAVKACWQDMNEEAADELVGREPHDFCRARPSMR